MAASVKVLSDGSVMRDGDRVGSVERRVSVGPRGGSVVRWVAHSPCVPSAVYETRAAAASGVAAAWVAPCPCGGSYIDGVCLSCDSCSGCAECAPKHSYAGSVSHEVLSVDVQRHAAYLDAPASAVARVRVRYSYPDAPDRVHGFLFSSNDGGPGMVRMTSTMPRGTGLVSVDDPARFGSFTDDPVSWVHAFYA